ncbi:extracellular solute-binding protein [Paenibacillus thalictri]|uniref:Extracellular solute-binding protein n=1 Tax=Paenibacillus thalictri TaxID=2527873 RepID=A0A4Q9DWH7_9BACL|nr:extracellular solute-binding protein [Paenibacillus thalictri]TBL79521.1 extracellular solute-binding protein [Paenibacillus thalictri]
MKRAKSKWVAMTAAVAILAGCSQTAEPAPAPSTAAKPGEQPKPAAAAEPLKLQMMVPSYADVPKMDDEYWSEYQKRTGTKLELQWVPSGDYDTKFDLVMASGNIPEIIVGNSLGRPTLMNAVKNGAFWDLTPFLGDFSKYPNLKKYAAPKAWDFLKVDGKIYGVPRNRTQIDPSLKIRKDWLDKLNIPVPTTVDEYTAALKKIVDSDPGGNGKGATIGLINEGFLLASADQPILAAFGGFDPAYNSEGGMIHKNLTPAYTDLVAWTRKLYQDGIISKEFLSIKNTQAEQLFTTGRVASYLRNIWRDYSFEQEIKKVQPEAQVISLPPLKGPKGYAIWLQPGTLGAFYISKQVPEAKVKQILDYFERTMTEEFQNLAYYGIEGVHYKVVDGSPQLTDLGKKQITANVQQPLPLLFNDWAKVVNPAASKAYNDAKLKEVQVYAEKGKFDPFAVIFSDSWTAVWPKYENEWKSMVSKAAMGEISMDEYKAYVDKLNNMPDFKKAYQEFAKKYKEYYG